MTDGGEQPREFRSGFAALFGRPNAGKSTLMNRILGTKISAVSALPQTTRDRIAGIYTDDDRQIVFADLPGMMRPDDRLNECLRANVLDGISSVDVVVHLIDVEDPEPAAPEITEIVEAMNRPIILTVNKLDRRFGKVDAGSWAGERLPRAMRQKYARIIGTSALNGTGIDELLDEITSHLPEGPPLYDPEMLTDRDMRYLAQEMIREKTYIHLHEELPYSIAVEIDEFNEREQGKWYIRATLHVERESQKGIVIGRGGSTLKKISAEARTEIERICDSPVFLELWVKVRPKWRKNDYDLRRFGYKPPK